MKRSIRENRLFSFKGKIFLTSALLNLITICALSAIMYTNYSASEAKSLEKQASSLLSQLTSSSDMVFSRLDEISMSVYADLNLNSDISRFREKVEDGTSDDIEGVLLEGIITDRLKQYISTTEFVHSARLYMGTHAVYAGFTSEIIIPSQDTYRTLGFEDAAREADGRALVSPPYEQLSAQAGAPRTYKRLISYSRLLSDISVKHRKVPTAVLALDAEASVFQDLMDGKALSDGHQLFLIDQYGNVVASSGAASPAGLSEADGLMARQPAKLAGITALSFIPFSDLALSTSGFIYSMSLIALMLFAFNVILGLLISRGLTQPLGRLISTIDQIGEGDLTARAPALRQVEFNEITRQFNRMLDRMDVLIEENYVSKLKEKESQLLSLQMQINPHFLYNTLEAIKWKAAATQTRADKDEVGEMIASLSAMLRYSFRDVEREVPLREELAQARYYLSLQSVRFPGKFRAFFMIADGLETAPVPKLILQPLIENAILHGFEDRERGSVLIVYAERDMGELRLSVYDNGLGMPKDFPYEMLDTLRGGRASQFVGLRNVNERLMLKYGRNHTLIIRSTPGKNTKVIIRIPLPEE